MRPRTGIAAFATLIGAAGMLAVAAGTGSTAHAASTNSNKVKAGDLLVSGTIYTAFGGSERLGKRTAGIQRGCRPSLS
jgi:hypothetical protein